MRSSSCVLLAAASSLAFALVACGGPLRLHLPELSHPWLVTEWEVETR